MSALSDDITAAAELLDRIQASMTTTDRDGRNLEGRIRDHLNGQPRAASYDGDRVTLVGGHADPVGEAALRSDTAAADLRRLRTIVATVRRELDQAVTIAQHYTPRAATEKERRSVGADNDPGCVECARDDIHPGVARWVPVRSTTNCSGTLGEPLPLCAWHQRFVRDFGRLPTPKERASHHAGVTIKRPA